MKAAATGLERLRDCRVAVWGAGVEGRAVAREAISRGSSVVFVDDRPGLGSVHVDGADLPVRSPSALADERCDYLVRSPGVSLYRDELADVAKSGCTVTSATAMWLEDFEGSRVVGVTGTKGKTTTAWITKLLLEACGLRVALGGNMGTPLTALYSEPSDVYVVEISSFQAADITVSPPVGVLTLVAPDHLDWHHGYGNYVRDKLNLFDHSRGIDVAVNSTSLDAMTYTERLDRRTLYGSLGRFTVDRGRVLLEGSELLCDTEVPLRGEHNLVNVCGALSACTLLGEAPPERQKIIEALHRFPSLPSRLETVGFCGAIEFVNDALASNPAGTQAALRTFAGRRIALIAGGQDRGVDLGELAAEIRSMSPAPAVVSLPGLGSRLAEELREQAPATRCVAAANVQEAVPEAAQLVEGEGVVLFSPGAPTPVVEGSYVQRGALFNRAAAQLAGTAP